MRVCLKTCLPLAVLLISAVAFETCAAQSGDPGLPDSVYVDSVVSLTSDNGILPVYIVNDQPLSGLELTMTFDSPDVHIDSFSFVGGRLEGISAASWMTIDTVVTVYCIAYSDLIPIGSGLMGALYVGYQPSVGTQLVTFDTVSIAGSQVEYSTMFSDATSAMFRPQFVPGYLSIVVGSCCLGDRGNIDNSPDDFVDISDLVYLVEYMFEDGPTPACMDEANLDADPGGGVDISDLVYLVDFMFLSGPPPKPCY
ncbi:MAG: hypothetical protein KAW91_03195 [candidate division Zixibacteria bacterium]|nr:hypothetical protein [candidate division Zixibacteria bacterium]